MHDSTQSKLARCFQEFLVFRGRNCAEIEQQLIVVYAAEHCWGAGPQRRSRLIHAS